MSDFACDCHGSFLRPMPALDAMDYLVNGTQA